MNNEEYMAFALELAEKGFGMVSPNPLVGAVIIKDDKIIGKGWHKKFGGNHAEVEAIIDAGMENFDGCTLIVNLEPCSHYGKTPPCSSLIIEKKFSRVVIGMVDPNPLVSGKGIQMLKDAGIEVVVGVMNEECKWLNRFFIKHITTGLPYIILKAAQSLDGSIAASNGESNWISSEESRRRVHVLRSQIDAVLIGKGTALADNPQLTVRAVDGRNPKRIILDTNLFLPLSLKLFNNDEKSNTIVCCGLKASLSEKADKLKVLNVNILEVEEQKNGELDINDLLKNLSEIYKINSVLVEGGSGIYSSFAEHNLIDEIQLFIAPKIFGISHPAFDKFRIDKLEQALNFKIKEISMSDRDVHVVAIKDSKD
jgi:diaminohydroxyphosphoribosylaminopyrimidine deaminase / 5-amino-6-(5-phosphoribosylamino)uracil reductase